MKFEELLDGGGLARAKIVFVEPAENPREVRDGGVAYEIQRMIVAERRAAVDFTTDEDRRRQRGISVDRGHCLVILHVFITECGSSRCPWARGNIPFN